MHHLYSQSESSIPNRLFEKHTSKNAADSKCTHATDNSEAKGWVKAGLELPLILFERQHCDCECGQEDEEARDSVRPHRYAHVHLQVATWWELQESQKTPGHREYDTVKHIQVEHIYLIHIASRFYSDLKLRWKSTFRMPENAIVVSHGSDSFLASNKHGYFGADSKRKRYVVSIFPICIKKSLNSPVNIPLPALGRIFFFAHSFVYFSLFWRDKIWAFVSLGCHPCGHDFLQILIWRRHEKDELWVIHLIAAESKTEPSVQWEADFHFEDLRFLVEQSPYVENKLVWRTVFERFVLLGWSETTQYSGCQQCYIQ